MTPARERVLRHARPTALAWTKSGLAAAAGVQPGVVQGLVEAGTLETVMMPAAPAALPPDPDYGAPELSAEQAAAADASAPARWRRRLFGHAPRRRHRLGQDRGLFRGGGGGGDGRPAGAHPAAGDLAHRRFPRTLCGSASARGRRSGIRKWRRAPASGCGAGSPTARCRWWSARARPCSCRSPNLGLIVVDEEHDLAYKQEERAFYSARDMAVVRGHLAGFPVVLSSATPSIESRVNADAGRYRRIVLSDRYMAAPLPEIEAVDLAHDQPENGRFLSPPLVAAMDETLAQKQQALLFLNRRGYAPLTLCRTCGHRFQCPNCSTWLVEHRFRGVLLCHHCGHSERRPEACPACGDTESLVPIGPGVERLAEEVAARFPEARTIVAVERPCRRRRRACGWSLPSIAKGEVDIVIGTQLVAKGHNFPFLKLVGVVDADLGLAHGDLRAAERTFQLLTPGDRPGRAHRAAPAGRSCRPTRPTIR